MCEATSRVETTCETPTPPRPSFSSSSSESTSIKRASVSNDRPRAVIVPRSTAVAIPARACPFPSSLNSPASKGRGAVEPLSTGSIKAEESDFRTTGANMAARWPPSLAASSRARFRLPAPSSPPSSSPSPRQLWRSGFAMAAICAARWELARASTTRDAVEAAAPALPKGATRLTAANAAATLSRIPQAAASVEGGVAPTGLEGINCAAL